MSRLNSLTILRYGHVYEGGGGGMELYLSDINRELLERGNVHLIQVQLTSDASKVGASEEVVGKGVLTRVSLFVEQSSHEAAVSNGAGSVLAQWKARFQAGVLQTPGMYPFIFRPLLSHRKAPRRPGEPSDVGQTIREIYRKTPLDLICLHSAGGSDAEEVLEFAAQAGVPSIYIHHFSNDRLAGVAMCSQLERTQAIAGVTGVGVPRMFRERFREVWDGIDLTFFSRMSARPLPKSLPYPVIFYPARITPAKGQMDLLQIAAQLKCRGLKFHLILAGRADGAGFLEQLQAQIVKLGLEEEVEYVGQLGPEALRDWYAAADILAFPTHHHEGLPRTLLECQAMEVPAVVYDIGGTREAISHSQTGYLVREGDAAEFVEKVEDLLSSPNLRAEMGQAGRERVRRQFSLEALALRHEEVYLDVISEMALRRNLQEVSV